MTSLRRSVYTASGMRAMTDNRFLGPLRYRTWRRGMTVFLAATTVLTAVGLLNPGWPAWIWIGFGTLTIALVVLLMLATRNLSNTVDDFADERDRAVRDRAHRLAYWALGAPLGAVIGAGSSFAARRTENGVFSAAVDPGALAALGFVLLVLYATLPLLIIAWTEPDPMEDV